MTKTPAHSTAAIYVRISRDKKGDELGVRRQEYECKALCEREGWTVVGVYSDNDISATTGKHRPGFEALLDSKPERIVCHHTDRLARMGPDLERVISLGAPVNAVTAGFLDLATSAGRAVARTITAWSQYEGEVKSDRIKSKAQQKARSGQGWWSVRPFGMDLDGTHREAEAEALRKAYAELLQGKALAKIVRELNASGLRTPHGKEWGHPAFRRVLLNPRNAGIRTYMGEEVGKAAWEPIIDEPTYRAAVRLLKDPSRRKTGDGKRVGLLVGVAKCGRVHADGSVCGGKVSIAWKGGRKGDVSAYSTYECERRCLSMRTDYADSYVIRKVLGHMSEADAHEWWDKPSDRATGDGESLQREADQLRERLGSLAEDYADGHLSRAQMLTGTERVNARLAIVQDELATTGADSAEGLYLDTEYLLREMHAEDIDRPRQVIQGVVRSITLYPVGQGKRLITSDKIQIEWRKAAPKVETPPAPMLDARSAAATWGL